MSKKCDVFTCHMAGTQEVSGGVATRLWVCDNHAEEFKRPHASYYDPQSRERREHDVQEKDKL